jgi:hypothetical protein
MYLRCATRDRLRAWVDWLPWAEYYYNTSFHIALRTTPFQVVYGRPLPPLLPHAARVARTDAADALLHDRDHFLAEFRECLLQAQQYAKRHYDDHHRELEFAVGDWVWLRLLHRPTHSLDARGQRASSALATRDLSRSSSASARSPIAFNFQRAPVSMTCSMSGCSSLSLGTLRQPCLRCMTAGCFLPQHWCCAPSFAVASGMCSCSGKACLQMKPLGNSWRTLRPATPTFSLRKRRGEML